MNPDRRYPCIDFMEQAARRRIPRFAWDYLSSGIGREITLTENIANLDRIKLLPRYLVDDADLPDMTHHLLGRDYALPFGVSPMGLSGIIWPGASEHLARAAKQLVICRTNLNGCNSCAACCVVCTLSTTWILCSATPIWWATASDRLISIVCCITRSFRNED